MNVGIGTLAAQFLFWDNFSEFWELCLYSAADSPDEIF
jgi:hypothetical protein